jgi:2-dehydro-3-deoxyphosphogluconate aldolase/(4S)-4-hydroxy-2-oxoglutarate aldolase
MQRRRTMTDVSTSIGSESPVELFDMYVAHIGINASDPAEAERIAGMFETLMGLRRTEQAPSYFAGTLVEVMKRNGRGEKGHIGFHVNDIDRACEWFEARGFKLNRDSRAAYDDGTTRLIYFEEEIAGFAIHLTADE